ncbi:MAG: hypothetical protein ACI4RB_02450 [Acutalibacteraceae bacterium]
MEQKICKNKKCQRPLPEGYKHKYCENCRNEQAKKVKDVGKATLSLAVLVGGTLVTVATKGVINLNKK